MVECLNSLKNQENSVRVLEEVRTPGLGFGTEGKSFMLQCFKNKRK